jgi:hypothetical protein
MSVGIQFVKFLCVPVVAVFSFLLFKLQVFRDRP